MAIGIIPTGPRAGGKGFGYYGWRLYVLVVAVGLCACSLPRRSDASDDAFQRKLRATTTLHWDHVPLRSGLERLSQAQEIAIFLDRRVDPGKRIAVSMENIALCEVLDRIAVQHGFAVATIGPVVYMGPKRITRSLDALADEHREAASQKSLRLRRTLHVQRAIAWPVLTEPRELAAQLAKERGIRIVGLDRIPHDLWPAGKLPAMRLADQLTILLAGFDLAWQPTRDHRGLEIVPITEEELVRLATAGGAGRPDVHSKAPSHRRPTRGGKTGYTLRVEEQPIGPVLRQLASKLELEIELETEAIKAAGILLSQRVTFEVKRASLEELLTAAITPAELAYELEGKKLRILPAKK